jgi:hypothetical protein
MAGRNDADIAAALQAVAQAVGKHHNAGAGANDGVRMLETFLRNHPPTSKEGMTLMKLRRGSKKLKEFSGSCNAMRFRRCVLVRTC